jgi:ATP synthase protein I
MSDTSPSHRSIALQVADVHRLLAIQAGLVVLTSLTVWGIAGTESALAAAYGGAAAVLSAWLLGRRVRRAAEISRSDPGRETTVLYLGAVQRFALILVLFAVGMGQLGLAPVPLLIGFGLAQLTFLFSGPRVGPQTSEKNTLEKWG